MANVKFLHQFWVKPNLVEISKNLITEERNKVGTSLLCDITFVPSQKNTKRIPEWGENVNIYMRINTPTSGNRFALMHIRGGYCVVIPYIMCCEDGVERNLVEQLERHYYTFNGFFNVYTNDKMKNIYLYRQILAFYYYGDINAELPVGKEVHHVDYRFYNLIECLRLVTSAKHDQFTKSDVSQWRNEGKKIYTLQELEKFLLSIEDVANDCSEKEM